VLATQLVLAARRDVPDVSVTDGFGGRAVAVETGSSTEALVRARYPQARLLPFADVRSAVRALAAGQADLFIGYQHLIVYHVEKELLANVELRSTLGPGATPLGPAVSSREPVLHGILDKAIASVSTVDQSRLAARWLPAGSTAVRLPAVAAELTAAKREWVERHGRLRVGYDNSFAPITSGGALGEFRGLGAEVFKLAAQKVGLQIEQEVGGSFAEVYQRGVAGELDVIVGMARSPSRRQDYDFVGPAPGHRHHRHRRAQAGLAARPLPHPAAALAAPRHHAGGAGQPGPGAVGGGRRCGRRGAGQHPGHP